MRFLRALIVLHRTFASRPLRSRFHILVRFLTSPMLRVAAHVQPGVTLLDIGAGHGLFAKLALERGARRVITVEPDVRKTRPVAGVLVVAGYDPCITGMHDTITVIDVLYKIPIQEWDGLLERIVDRMKPGGLLLIKEQDPTDRWKNAWNRIQERMASKAGLTLGESFSYEAPDVFVSRLERAGFGDVRIERIGSGYPHPHVLYVARKR
ncbi:MAG: methyltransferase domain-containing protein [Acidobacteriota bacterium]